MNFLTGLGGIVTIWALSLLVWKRKSMAHPTAGTIFIAAMALLLAHSATAWLSRREHGPWVDLLNNGVLPLAFRMALGFGIYVAIRESEAHRRREIVDRRREVAERSLDRTRPEEPVANGKP